MNLYQQYCKPSLSGALHALGLDKTFHRASAGKLYYTDEQNNEQEVLDLLGGYGAVLIGHNHPRLIDVATRNYAIQRPFNNQFSVRNGAAELALQLNGLLQEEAHCKENFLFSFTSTGAESIEIAITHAERARFELVEKMAEEAAFSLSSVCSLSGEAASSGSSLYDWREQFEITEQQLQMLNIDKVESLSQLTQAITAFNQQQLNKQPHFISLKNAFHGKLASSVQLTHGEMYRKPYQHLGLNVHFLPVAEISERVEVLANELHTPLFKIKKVSNKLVLETLPLPMVAAILVEPVQGEGGIHCLTEEDAQALHQVKKTLRCPLIVDEIQSGSGRCGSLLAGKAIGLKPDYVVLSKALGGGIAKIGLVAIKESAYCKGFDLVQSSTFGEDEHSAAIAREYLNILHENNGAVLNTVRTVGEALKSRLQALQQAFPDIIRDVRGRGLLLGVEFIPLENAYSVMFRGINYQESLGYVTTGFLLNNHNVRVAPSSSAPNVVRLEPSIHLSLEDIDTVINAFEEVCNVIRHQDAYYLMRYLSTGAEKRATRENLVDFRPHFSKNLSHDKPADAKVAFVNHLISSDWMTQVDPSMEGVPVEETDYLLRRLGFDWRAAPFPPMRITSKTGATVDFTLYPLAVTSAEIEEMLQCNDLEKIRDAVNERVATAQADGCKVAGLGMFTSVVTNNCKSVRAPDIGLTTGNSLTVAMAVEAVTQELQQKQTSVKRAAVIGAAGNIGSVYAAMISDFAEQVILIGSGRRGSNKRLLKAAYFIYESCWHEMIQDSHDLIQDTHDDSIQDTHAKASHSTALAAKIKAHPKLKNWLENTDLVPTEKLGQLIHELMTEHYGYDSPILVSDDIEMVHNCELVVCATNASSSFLSVDLLGQGAVVCDVSVPHNISQEDLEQRPDIRCIRGGVVSTPNDESLDTRARAYLKEGQVYACMAESIVLGLEGDFDHYSYGDLNKQQVTRILAKAKKHGFKLSEVKDSESM